MPILEYSIENKKEGQMIHIEKIIHILELALFSAYIKGEQPVSVLVTAPVEAGKTELVLKFAKNEGQ